MFYIKEFDRQFSRDNYAYNNEVKDFIRNTEKILKPLYAKHEEKDLNVGFIEHTMIFQLSLPGFKRENITVTYTGDVITITAEPSEEKEHITFIKQSFMQKKFVRKLFLVDDYVGGKVSWVYNDGIITISVEINGVVNTIEPSEELSFGNGESQKSLEDSTENSNETTEEKSEG